MATCSGAERFGAREARTRSSSCVVATISGNIQGRDHGASCAFVGVPFARPPLADLRWKPPQPVAPWAPAVFDATTPPSSCSTVSIPGGTPAGVEDCLTLNIWTSDPPLASPAPVIVWLHPGSFFGASANFPSHDGRRLVEETGVVVVAPNYRLGPFGFLAHTALTAEDSTRAASGNYGLLDQQAALVWVRDNIARFGGDWTNVTIAGTSAGGQSVGLHLVSPGSGGLFQRAIVQSAFPALRMPTLLEGEAQGKRVADALGCTDPASVLTCMRSKPRDQVLLALAQAMEQVTEPSNRVHWRPIVDGDVLSHQPRTLFEQGAFHQVPTIVGSTRDEGWGNFITRSFPMGVDAAQYESWVAHEFGGHAPGVLATYPAAAFSSPVEAMARVVGDGQFVCEARRLARLIGATGTPAFLYSYEYGIDDLSIDHVIHGVESNLIFGNDYVPPMFANHVLTSADLELHEAMSQYWTRFAAVGNPNSTKTALVHWPAFQHPQ
ncbi:MAG: carboxylesterase/lipase family protein, partial [Vicinamibacterales bacterium]